MLKVAITGGIGSGKSTVCKFFKELYNVPTFNSDECAREAENNPEIQKGFKDLFGDDIFVDGQLDRPKLRSLAFVNKELLTKLNNLVIPFIKEEFAKFVKEHDAPYCLFESAIIFETKSESNFDLIIAVVADLDIRIQRVLKRDGMSMDELQNKLNAQLPDQFKIDNSDFVITNNGELLTQQIVEINNQIQIYLFNSMK